MTKRRAPSDRTKKPLDAARLDEMALAYVARFATTRAKLARYLGRKLRERGWDSDAGGDDSMACCDAIVEKMVRLGFVDDRQYAAMRGQAMTRRGLGVRRVKAQLWVDGVAPDDAVEAVEAAADSAITAAIGFARRRRFGPFARSASADPKLRERQVAAFARAGHAPNVARRILALAPGDEAALAALDEAVALD